MQDRDAGWVAQSGRRTPCIVIFGWLRRGNRDVIERLYGAMVEASRQRSLYDEMTIPDTFEGRFESLTLHAVLVLRRLRECEAPGPEIAQSLVDTIFQHFDRTLREMGVGDTTVPKRMKTMAEAFLGRSVAYAEALEQGSVALAETLKRNVYAGVGDAALLTRYVEAAAILLGEQKLRGFAEGRAAFPDPARLIEERA